MGLPQPTVWPGGGLGDATRGLSELSNSNRRRAVKTSYRPSLLAAAPLIFLLTACGGGDTADDMGGDAETAGAMAEPEEVEVTLEPVGDATAGGTAIIRRSGESVVVDLGADTGQGPGNYPTYIQEGTCASPGSVAVQLNDIVGAEPGDGEAQSTFPASALSADGTYSIVLEGRAGEPLICGDIASLGFL